MQQVGYLEQIHDRHGGMRESVHEQRFIQSLQVVE